MTNNDAAWKKKYADLIKQLDEQDKVTLEYQQVLHRCINKLGILAQEIEPALSDKLLKLRELLTEQPDPQQVSNFIEGMTEDFLQAERVNAERVQQFKQVLTNSSKLHAYLSLPKNLSSELRRLQKTISKLQSSNETQTVMLQLNDIVSAILVLIEEKKLTLFPAQSAVKALKAFFTANDDLIDEALQFDLPENMQEDLARLIDKLGVSSEQMDQARALYEQIERGLGVRALPKFIEELTELVTQVAHSDEERVEEFCHHFKDQVATSKHFFGDLHGTISQQATETTALNKAVQTQFEKITSEVYSKTSEEVVPVLDKRLKHMVTTVKAYQEKSEQALLAAVDKIEGLKKQLESSEQEINALNQHLAEKRFGMQKDVLTELPNRQAYEDWMSYELERWGRYHRPMSFVVGDIDHFKKINDNYGHDSGDRAIAGCAKLLRKKLRGTDFLARFGGEEFVIVLPETDLEAAFVVIEALRQAIASARFTFKEKHVSITMSFGLTEVNKGDDKASVFKRADEALYQAKNGGRNQTVKA